MTAGTDSQLTFMTNILAFFVICPSIPFVGKQMTCDDVVVGLEERVDTQPKEPRRFGTAGPGPNLFREIWKNEDHVFAAEGGPARTYGHTQEIGHPERVSSDILNPHPVEVLVVEEGPEDQRPKRCFWERWLDRCREENRPDYVVIASSAQELVLTTGLQSKWWRRVFRKWNYEADYWFVRGHEHGGVVRQDRCLVILRHQRANVGMALQPPTLITEDAPRSGRNTLRPVGIPRNAWIQEQWIMDVNYPAWIRDATAPCQII